MLFVTECNIIRANYYDNNGLGGSLEASSIG